MSGSQVRNSAAESAPCRATMAGACAKTSSSLAMVSSAVARNPVAVNGARRPVRRSIVAGVSVTKVW